MNWFRRKTREQDLDRELEGHLEAEIAERMEAGATRDDAQFGARRALGNRPGIEENVREAWGWRWLEQIQQDLQYALRGFFRTPGFTAMVIFTLAGGIGANTAIFSVVDAVFLRPLPYRDAKRLVAIWQLEKHDRSAPPFFDKYKDFLAFQRNSRAFDQMAAATWAVSGRIFSGHGAARDVLAMPVSINFFQLLGREAKLGRTFHASDLQRGCTAVVTNTFWRRVLNGDAGVVGKEIHLDDVVCTVVGVMPADVTFFPNAISMWTLITPLSPIAHDPDHAAVGVFAHLRAGVSLRAAQGELQRIFDETHRRDKVASQLLPVAYPLQEQFAYLTGPNLRRSLLVLFAAVSFVLLIACLNVGNLLLGRFESRHREIAVRAALGCGRIRLLRQLLTESLLLSAASAALGVVLAELGVSVFNATNPVQMPPGNAVVVNLAVLLYTSLLGVATTIVFGFSPAWRATQVDINDVLKGAARNAGGSRSMQRFARVSVTLEVALSLVLLAGAGLLVQSVQRLGAVPLGFRPGHLFSFDVSLPIWKYQSERDRERLEAKIWNEALRFGGSQVALASSLPAYGGRYGGHTIEINGRASVNPERGLQDVAYVQVTPNYFGLMGVPLRSGRNFNGEDNADGRPVVIINQALARRYFTNESPLGKQIRFANPGQVQQWWTITGVIEDEKQADFFREMSWRDVPCVYRPVMQDAPSSLAVISRIYRNSSVFENGLRRRIASLDPQMPVGEVEVVTERLARLLGYPRFRALLLGIFAAIAILLASIGLYGVLAQLVRQRTRELGVRIALGARRRDVVSLVVRQSMFVVIAGMICGAAVCLVVTRYLASLLYGVTSTDAVTFVVAALILLLVAFFATYLPARRAGTADPAIILRYE